MITIPSLTTVVSFLFHSFSIHLRSFSRFLIVETCYVIWVVVSVVLSFFVDFFIVFITFISGVPLGDYFREYGWFICHFLLMALFFSHIIDIR